MSYDAKAKLANSLVRSFQRHVQIKVYCNIERDTEQKQTRPTAEILLILTQILTMLENTNDPWTYFENLDF